MAHTYRGQDRRQLRERRMRRHALTPKQKARAGEVAVITSGRTRIDPATRPVAKSELVRGAVVLAGVDFVEGSDAGRKVRPVLVIDNVTTGRGGTCAALAITSAAMKRGFVGYGEYEFDGAAAGLKRGRSVVRLHRVLALSASDVYEVIGQLSDEDMAAIAHLGPSLPGAGFELDLRGECA